MATIKDVAERAGVTVTTVSRILNNRGSISENTRKKVYAIMEELNYQPNELARALFRKKSNIIGLIIPNVSHPFFAELSNYIESYAYKNGYKVFFVLTSYKDLDIALLEPRNTPLFVIDSDYYGNKLVRAYVNDFKNELKGRDRKAKGEYEGGLLFYENGVYQKSYFYLPATTN